MKPNIETTGRLIRGLSGAVTVIVAVAGFFWGWSLWLLVPLLLVGLFTIFEASIGWCLVRAMGVKTKF